MSNRMSTGGISRTANIARCSNSTTANITSTAVSDEVIDQIAAAGLLKYVEGYTSRPGYRQKRVRKLIDRSDWTWASKLRKKAFLGIL